MISEKWTEDIFGRRKREELLMGQHYRFYMFTVLLRTTGTVSQPFGPQTALSLEFMERRRRSKAFKLAGDHINTDVNFLTYYTIIMISTKKFYHTDFLWFWQGNPHEFGGILTL
ncbi:hypothetical protein E1B28_008250 [Marasmius oreades]|uniref:Uncharacterized protein n=1 Tax=Marasmius oreades TaxID=181124 RepID=A0A9P7URX5_9AGAR|nr:uncharacterized protein E1B28_008250 [Marasmius oreades]KAG7091848.1 hypothetical protein E1B28_008250 [Marasmius oreades]